MTSPRGASTAEIPSRPGGSASSKVSMRGPSGISASSCFTCRIDSSVSSSRTSVRPAASHVSFQTPWTGIRSYAAYG
jgi:hypothetical protein